MTESRITKKEVDEERELRLLKELPEIFDWLLEGLKGLVAEGFDERFEAH